MTNIIIPKTISIQEKMKIMQENAAFDIADGDGFALGNFGFDMPTNDLTAIGQSISNIKTKPLPPSAPKTFVSNDCSFNCKYCGCRHSVDKQRYVNNPDEIADMALLAQQQNNCGIFLTSAICKNADYTEELIIEAVKHLRVKRDYHGYIHAKIMPGADPLLIRELGFWADRVSVNIEVPHSDGYKLFAKQKNRSNILNPMKAVRDFQRELNPKYGTKARSDFGRTFAPAGQTTQVMAGSMGESDRTLAILAQALYKQMDLKRVYYSPFHSPPKDEIFHGGMTPRWRGRRLYQADRLIALYGMTPDELLPENEPFLEFDIDPKVQYALRNRHLYPVEVNTADYEMLLRVPGIGIYSAKKIIKARKIRSMTPEILRYVNVSLKKSKFFITCDGKYYGSGMLDSLHLRKMLWSEEFVFMQGAEQMSMFNTHLLPIDYDVSV